MSIRHPPPPSPAPLPWFLMLTIVSYAILLGAHCGAVCDGHYIYVHRHI